MIWVAAWLPMAAGLVWLAKWRLRWPVPPAQKIPLLLLLYALLPPLLWAWVYAGEQDTLVRYGLVWQERLATSMALGVAFGVGGIGLLLALKIGLGWLRWQKPVTPAPGSAQLGAWVVTAVPIGLLALVISGVEEVIFRGFVVTQLAADFGWVGVVAIASAIFAVLHLVWDGSTGLPQQPGLWLMGAVLILARWADGGWLGLPIGLHAGWIGTLALIDTLGLVVPAENSPRWLAGKPDQPLTGLLDMGLLAATAALIYGWSQI